MNLQECDVLNTLFSTPYINQRILSETTGYSIGSINKSIKNLVSSGYLNKYGQISELAKKMIVNNSPQNAIILAAGIGMRMVPINHTIPKALIEVKGEKLIERLIKQLHDAGVYDITVVVGFMKDSFEYLIDKYGVDLVYNPDYSTKNNYFSLKRVADRIHNTYIIPADIWSENNPFSKNELYSWYMVSSEKNKGSHVRINRKKELVKTSAHEVGDRMIGISYLVEPEASTVRNRLKTANDEEHINDYWEDCLFAHDRMILHAKIVKNDSVVEINTFEQLREFDADSNHLKSDAINTIMSALKCSEKDITNIQVMKKGMTNRSFYFNANGEKYLMRIPGEGTSELINRQQEDEVYKAIADRGLCDDPIYINPQNGYKITKYLDNVRTCNPFEETDLIRCMNKLREFHRMKLVVPHTFDVFEQIELYEQLRHGKSSVYVDYRETKEKVLSLKAYIESETNEWCLAHIDAVCDNFLFYKNRDDYEEQLQLTDWEYSGMQDPHIDIAMFCIYSLYDKEQCDHLINIYFENECDDRTRTKIYCYIAICGLLWSNWCEYKSDFGVEFGEYSFRQYRYAKEFYKYAYNRMGEDQTKGDGCSE